MLVSAGAREWLQGQTCQGEVMWPVNDFTVPPMTQDECEQKCISVAQQNHMDGCCTWDSNGACSAVKGFDLYHSEQIQNRRFSFKIDIGQP